MTYKALVNIGGYKKGDTVPDDKAIVWESMYIESPVKKSGEVKEDEVKVEEVKNELDLNGDGKVDNKDASLAGKVMAKMRHTKKGKKR